MTLPFAVLTLVLSVGFYTAGEYFSKLWGLSPSVVLMALAIACYITSSLLWFPALLYRNQLSTVGISWDVMALCGTLLMGLVIFQEHLSGKNWLGLALGLIAVYLLLT